MISSKYFVHPQALCESDSVGEGTRIWAFAHVMSGARIGRECNVGGHAFIESGAVIGDRVTVKNGVMVWNGVTVEDDVFIGPGVIFTNDRFPRSPRMEGIEEVARRYAKPENWLIETRVRKGASLGAGCLLLPGVTVGAYAMVAAGAIVRSDVSAQALTAGNPAEQHGWVCVCGRRLKQAGAADWQCEICRRHYKLGSDRVLKLI